MSIEITEKLVGIWFVELPGGDDWQGGLTEHEPGARYEFRYRFRRSSGPAIWRNEDIKKWGGGEFTAKPGQTITREMMITMIEKTATVLASVAGTKVNRVMMPADHNVKLFTALLSAQPWVHMKMFDDPEECVNFLRANGFHGEADAIEANMRKGEA